MSSRGRNGPAPLSREAISDGVPGRRRVLTTVVADDYPIVREGLRAMLESTGTLKVVAECSDGVQALRAVREHHPDVAVLDLCMPSMTGLEVLIAVKQERLRTRVVLLAALIDPSDVSSAIKHGVRGIVLKDQAPDDLLTCLSVVARGGRWIDRACRVAACSAPSTERLDRLSRQEQRIASLVSSGLSNRDIARELNVTEGTVKVHLRNIFDKLEVTSRTAVAVMTLAQGPLPAESMGAGEGAAAA